MSRVVDKGVYITPQLNLKELIRSGETSNFATRLVAYGAKQEDGSYLSFRDINNGNDYVSDNSYSNKVVWAYWHDERYKLKEKFIQYVYLVLGFINIALCCPSIDKFCCLILSLF